MAFSAFASPPNPVWFTGRVTGFDIQAGLEPGVALASADGSNLFVRLCNPTQPGIETNYYFFELFKQSKATGNTLEVAYIETKQRDPTTGDNKLCVVQVKY